MVAIDDGAVRRDLDLAAAIVEEELARCQRWLAGRSAAAAVSRLRADLEVCAQEHIDRATRGVPEQLQPLIEERIRRAVRQFGHGPTKRLLEAAAAGDDFLVEVLSGLIAQRAARA